MKTKLFTLLLAVAASVGTMFAESGTCGENLTWDLTNGVLTISGTGAMNDYGQGDAPWCGYREIISQVVINDGVTSIGSSAFWNCIGLTSVTIPNSVTSIGFMAFFYCTVLTSVTIPNSVTSIGVDAFLGCFGLTSIDVVSDNSNYCSVDGVLFNKNKTILIQYPMGKQGAYTIPNSVTSIENDAFYACTGLTSVTIGNSVTSIGESAFQDCTGLTSVTIGNGVSSIGNFAFTSCRRLTSVTIPNSVTSIGDGAFYECTGLTSVTNYAATPQIINNSVFLSVNMSACTLYVPKGSLSTYQAADVWKEFGKIIGIDAPQEIHNLSSDHIQSTKLLHNGQIFILRGDKTYTLQGQEVR